MDDESGKSRTQLREELADTRQQLEQQAEQARRERAVERIRAEAMAMQCSDDLLVVVAVMYQEMALLGMEIRACNIMFVDEITDEWTNYIANENPKKYGMSWTRPGLVEVNEEVVVRKYVGSSRRVLRVDRVALENWHEGKVWSFKEIFTEETIKKRAIDLIGENPPSLAYFQRFLGEWTVTNVPFRYGYVGFSERAFREEHIAIVKELTEGISLGYLRFLDFQKLEEQNTELQEALDQLNATQQELILREKMVTLGQVAAGVAHEVNTPLGVIHSTHDTIVRAAEKLSERFSTVYEKDRTIKTPIAVIAEAGRVMSSATERLSAVIHSLRNFARLDEAEFQVADLHEGLESALVLLQTQMGDGVKIVRDFADLEPIFCSPGQLNQVFMHVLRNALQAIEGEGEIRIRTFREDSWICVRIRDTGVGIPPSQLENIFDFGFRRTEGRMKMGVGLSADYRIIRAHHGDIHIESEVGRGTEVTIRLPLKESDME